MTRKRSPGDALVSAIKAEMTAEGVVPDAKEIALLTAARQLVDRMAALELVVAQDGEMVTSPSGRLSVHPAVVEHRQLAVALPKILGGIVVGDSSSGAVPDVRKQRAARVRWDREAARREARSG